MLVGVCESACKGVCKCMYIIINGMYFIYSIHGYNYIW